LELSKKTTNFATLTAHNELRLKQKKMKQILFLFTIIFFNTFGFSQTYLIEGNAFLEEQTNYSEIVIIFERVAPTQLIDTVYTNNLGAFSMNVEEGVFNITYEKEGYFSIMLSDISIYSDMQLDDVTLETVGLIGNLSGILHSGTYIIKGDISVTLGDTLVIEPGTILKFKQDYEFLVIGTLYANGTVEDSIIFTRFEPGITWKGIKISNSTHCSAEISYSIIEHSNNHGILLWGKTILHNSTIRNNITNNNGAGIMLFYGSYPILCYNLKIYNNEAEKGGGIQCYYVTKDNNNYDNYVFSNCLIYNNKSIDASGLYIGEYYPEDGVSALFTNCVFSKNECLSPECGTITVERYGGDFTNNVIAYNIGYGIKFGTQSNEDYFAFNNTFNNTFGNYQTPPTHVGINVTVNENGDDCDAYHNIELDPLYEDAENYNFRISESSPCIDVGLNNYVYNNFDFNNNIRIWNGNEGGSDIVDMGAFEYGAPIYTNIDNQQKAVKNIFIYPNPTNGIVNIEFVNNNIQKITISDITGKQIIEKTTIQQNEMIDLSSFESGIYIISIQTDNEIFTTKIVKE